MCTVVLSWHPDARTPVRLLALRDEFTSRAFDLPAAWWQDQPAVIGGRDRVAGGSWCVSDTGSGNTALVVNRTERFTAAPGAPSRGILPLLAVRQLDRWTEQLDPIGMAGFNLLLAGPRTARLWSFDGTTLTGQALSPGEHLITPGGLDDAGEPRVARHAAALTDVGSDTGRTFEHWKQVLGALQPAAEPDALIVARQVPAGSYGTVFGQLIAAGPGRLLLQHSQAPWQPASWTVTNGSADVGEDDRHE